MSIQRKSEANVRPVSRGDFRAYRRSRGLDQTAFSKMLGVNQATISRWESGRTPIDQNKCRRIFENFDLPGSVAKPIEPFDKVELDSHWPSLIKFYRQSRCISQMDLHDAHDASQCRVTFSNWTRERLRSGFWRGEVPMSRCAFPIDETSVLEVTAFPVLFEDGMMLSILHSQNVNHDSNTATSDNSFSMTHVDEIIG